MEVKNVKQRAAEIALQYIQNGQIVGLGGGSTIAYLIQYIKERNYDIKVVTPSMRTKELCIQAGLEVLHTSFVDYIDVAFDGCDAVDTQRNALKSGGAIHTTEKLIASMAKDYILLVDESKVVEKFPTHIPVAIEVLPAGLCYVEKKVKELGARVERRTAPQKDGYVITDDGNYVLDAYYEEYPEVKELQNQLKSITGIIETSLFLNEVSKVIITQEYGYVII